MATNAILRLQKNILTDLGYPYLYTSRFTQDCVENLFSVVRSKQRRPTPLQFKSHLRTITLSQYMLEVKNSSYSLDDREYLSGFMDHLKSIDNQQQPNSSKAAPSAGKLLDFSKVEVSTMAKQLLSAIGNAEANAVFHVCGYMIGSISKTSTTCSLCRQGCVTPAPFDKNFGRFSALMAEGKGKSHTYPSEKIFHFVLCLDSIIAEHFADKSFIDKSKIDVARLLLQSLPLELPNCHNIKFKLINRFLQFRMKSDRIRKIRKRKFDSRSMLN